ncbi:hypothetical protein ABXV17_22775 [Vibrio harveyi]
MIRNAWHFYYALRLVFKVVCGGIGIGIGIGIGVGIGIGIGIGIALLTP